MRSSSRLGSAPVGAPNGANIQVGAGARLSGDPARWSVQNTIVCISGDVRSCLWTHAKHLLLAANAMITAPRPRVVIIIAAPLLRWPDVDRQGALLLLDLDLQQCGLCLGLRRPHCAATAAARAASIAGRQRRTGRLGSRHLTAGSGHYCPHRDAQLGAGRDRRTQCTKAWHQSAANRSKHRPSLNGNRELRDNVLDPVGTLSCQILSSKLKRVVVSPLDRIKIR